MPQNKILSTKTKSFQKKISEAPLLPGCYLYKDKKGKVLYVGKAKILRNRVKSYFSNYSRVDLKIKQMVDLAYSVEYAVVDSEVEALILEALLIKKYLPKYNSMLIDDKSYGYVKFSKPQVDKNGKQLLPSIEVVREIKMDKHAEYFGPYPDSRPVKRLLRRLRRIFPYCTSKNKVIFPKDKNKYIESPGNRPCFEAQIGLCSGACAGQVTKSEYIENIRNIKKFFKGDKHKLIRGFERQMKKASKTEDFEEAARLRNLINDIKYVGSNLHLDKDLDEVAIVKIKKEKRERAQLELIEKLDFPKEQLKSTKKTRIECYDISNIQGTNATGSMVVFINGEPKPELYRRFRIRMKNEPNDFAMLQEVLARRFRQYVMAKNKESKKNDAKKGIELPKTLSRRLKTWKSDKSFSELPSLIIIDGGKGQLSSTYEIVKAFGLTEQVPIVGLAKREEEIFKVKSIESERKNTMNESFEWDKVTLKDSTSSIFEKIKLSRRSEALYLVQRIRDEAHRFALKYHRKLRSKTLQIC